MKIHAHRNASNRGSALIITLTLGVIMLVIAVSYLTMIGTQQKLVVRSESWNASLTMAEAGVEEAMAQINSSPTNFSVNGWTASGGGSNTTYGPVSHSLSGGSYTVSVVVTTNQLQPVIYSTGYVPVAVSGDTVSRTVRVAAIRQVLANIGVGAKGNITMNGKGLTVDSYNSHMTNLSTGGLYDPTKTSTNGNVASVGGVVNPGNHTIAGNLYLGPTATYSGTSGTGGNVSGTVFTDFNIDFPDVTLPNVTWVDAPTTTNTHLITVSGNYTIKDGLPIDIKAGVTATLNVTTLNYNMTSLLIHGGTTNSGTALVYLNGPTSASLSGNSAVDLSNRPENLQYFGLPTLTSFDFGGNAGFTGVIYAPEAALKLNGGGNNDLDVMGSVVAGSITVDGHFHIHYDESLKDKTPGLYVAMSWQEL